MVDSSFGTDADRFLTYCEVSKALSDHTLLAYRQDLEEFERFFSTRPTGTSLDSALVLDYVAFLKDRRLLKPATVRRRIACLRGFLRWREKTNRIPSPFRDLDLSLKRPTHLPRALSRRDLAAVTRAASDPFLTKRGVRRHCSGARGVQDLSRTTDIAIRLMSSTGVRVSELTSIALADIAADGSAIRITGKGSRERTVFVGNLRLRKDLGTYRRERLSCAVPEGPFLVNTKGEPLSPQSLRSRLKRISSTLGISPRVTPHRLRHTAATMLLEEGVDIRFVQRLLGHSSISTTEIYTHVSDTSLKAAMERADTIGKLEL